MFKTIALFLTALLSILPASPFQMLLGQIEKYEFLGFLNWFIPFDVAAGFLQAWLLCVAAYYLYGFLKNNLQTIISHLPFGGGSGGGN